MFNKKKIILATGLVMGVASCVSTAPIIIKYETQNHSSSSSNQNISKPEDVSKPEDILNLKIFLNLKQLKEMLIQITKDLCMVLT